MMGDAARERAKAFYRVAGFFPLTVCAIQLIMDNVTINIWVAVALLLIILVDFVESVRSFSSKTTACLEGAAAIGATLLTVVSLAVWLAG